MEEREEDEGEEEEVAAVGIIAVCRRRKGEHQQNVIEIRNRETRRKAAKLCRSLSCLALHCTLGPRLQIINHPTDQPTNKTVS